MELSTEVSEHLQDSTKLKMLENTDLIKMYSIYNIERLAVMYNCHKSLIRNELFEQMNSIEPEFISSEFNDRNILRQSKGAFKELKQTNLYKQLINK